ncbi:uncharacterized protein RJT20DRAFT_130728 [Scheffersomyces xylosifermentans]|uniref:uncharacterized protein n=1 Tax=Scheffersomyces xylosifermentans TaxID=1304137 RepID=UPI00315D3795
MNSRQPPPLPPRNMPEDSSQKRRHEEDTSDAVKKPRTESDSESNGNVLEDLNFLKASITKEIVARFETRISQLEREVQELKKNATTENESAGSSEASKQESVRSTTEEQQHKEDEEDEEDEKGENEEEEISSPPPVRATKATFGASSFGLKPTIITPLTSFTSNALETPTAPNTQENSPLPVFGSTTTFGKSTAEVLIARPNVFDSLPSKSETTPEAYSKPVLTSTFGANSKFGNAFQESLSKKSFLDTEEKPESGDDKDDKKTPAVQQYKQVELAPIDQVQTGEEDEKSHFSATAKLFELDLTKISEGWKERGLGPLHVNQSNTDKKQARLVMRSHGLLRVILNYKIKPDTRLLKGLESSLTPGKFIRLNSVRSDGTPIQYLLKFGSESIRNSLVDAVDELKYEISGDSGENGTV